MRLCYLFALLCLATLAPGQERMAVRFFDAATLQPASPVTIVTKTGKAVPHTDSAGYVIFSHDTATSRMIAISPGYRPDTFVSGVNTVYLQPLSMTLNEAVVRSSKVSRLSWPASEYVVDYAFWEDKIFLITFERGDGREARLKLVDGDGKELINAEIPDGPVGLFRSCVDSFYIVYGDRFYPISVTTDSLVFRRPYEIAVLPGLRTCECVAEGNKYFRIGDKTNFLVQYGVLPGGDSVLRPITLFENREAAMSSAQESMEILALLAAGKFSEAAREQTLQRMWDNGSYAHLSMPLFVSGSTVVIFDFASMLLRHFDLLGRPSGACPVGFEWKQKQQFQVLKDDVLGRFYIHNYDSKGTQTLQQLNVITGKCTGPRIAIEKAFAENVTVHGGAVYYLYKRANSSSTRQLYIQRM